VPADATAYAHRSSKVMVNIAAICGSLDEVERARPWVADVARAIHTGDDGAYVNFVADPSEAGVRAAYPSAVWERLRRVKAAYDPDNLFRGNANIPPATP
jgi:FAD/FMN-containing dehydrogenase